MTDPDEPEPLARLNAASVAICGSESNCTNGRRPNRNPPREVLPELAVVVAAVVVVILPATRAETIALPLGEPNPP